MISNSTFGQNAQVFFTARSGNNGNGRRTSEGESTAEDDRDSNMEMDIDCCKTTDSIKIGKFNSSEFTQEIQSHSKTVQALRKYLQRKLSTEDSSSEKESSQEKDGFSKSFDTTLLGDPPEASKPASTLTCSIVYSSPIPLTSGRIILPLQKQKSLDDYSTTTIPDSRYLRTDLCVPILLSRCTFCDQSFELEDDLRAHVRQTHWHYFLEKSNSYDVDSSDEALDLTIRKLTDARQTGSLPNLESISVVSNGSGSKGNLKKPVKCMTCGKGFSTKWNWKQHQKIHLRENLQAYLH